MHKFGILLWTSTLLVFSQLNLIVEAKQSIFKPCKASDPKLNECVTSTAQNLVSTFIVGIPGIKLDSFEPYTIDDIHSTNLGIIEFHFKNNIVYGALTSNIHNVKLDPVKHYLEISLSSTGYMISDYVVNGTLIILPVTGNGKSNITIVNTKYLYKLNYDIVKGKDGKDHWKIVKQQATYTPERVTFAFDNLFNGNKQLSDVVHQFANENWKDILAELGTPIMSKITRRATKQIGKFFALVPAEDLLQP